MSAGVRELARQLAVPAYALSMALGAERCGSMQELAAEYLQVGLVALPLVLAVLVVLWWRWCFGSTCMCT